jgi:hypothetical protein
MLSWIRRSILLLLVVYPIAGCSTGPWVKSVTAFSSGAAPSLDKISSAYTLTNDTHTLEEQAQLVANYENKGFRPGGLAPFIRPEDLKARVAAVDALRTYAAVVNELATGKQSDVLKLKPFATTITSSSASSTTMTTQQLDVALTGLDAVMKPYITHKVRHDLTPMLKAADPTVQTLCSLLSADMHTLRKQASEDYRVMLIEQSRFVQENGERMGAVEKRNEILRLTQIEIDAKKTDNDLAAALAATKQLAEAHHRLATGEKI